MTTSPKIIDGEPVPDIRHRQIDTFAVIASDLMDSLPRQTFDLSDEETRATFENWLCHVIAQAGHRMEWAFRRATDSALKQACQLMTDPARATRQKRSRRAEKDEWRRQQEESAAESARRRADHEQSLREMIADGQLTTLPGLRWRNDLVSGPRRVEDDAPCVCSHVKREHAYNKMAKSLRCGYVNCKCKAFAETEQGGEE